MRSIMQDNPDICWRCGLPANGDPLDWHHCFGGPLRKKSERYGLKVRLHHDRCHIFGRDAAHQSRETAAKIHKAAQTAAMKAYHWTADDFRREFYKNYL